jgi:hypothetical protein
MKAWSFQISRAAGLGKMVAQASACVDPKRVIPRLYLGLASLRGSKMMEFGGQSAPAFFVIRSGCAWGGASVIAAGRRNCGDRSRDHDTGHRTANGLRRSGSACDCCRTTSCGGLMDSRLGIAAGGPGSLEHHFRAADGSVVPRLVGNRWRRPGAPRPRRLVI